MCLCVGCGVSIPSTLTSTCGYSALTSLDVSSARKPGQWVSRSVSRSEGFAGYILFLLQLPVIIYFLCFLSGSDDDDDDDDDDDVGWYVYIVQCVV